MKLKKPYNYSSASLVEIDKFISRPQAKISLSGTSLTIPEIVAVAEKNTYIGFTKDKKILQKIKTSYKKMMQDIEDGIPIYGGNTGYGARASVILTEGIKKERVDTARKVSRGISHIDVSVGPLFDKDVVRAAMLIRVNMLMRGVSAVKIDDLDIYRKMLNKNIIPVVNQYGGIGASGDLAHNSRVLSAARHLPGVKVIDPTGKIGEARAVLLRNDIPQLVLDPKAGLGLVNGDNFSTGLATLLAVDTMEILLISLVVSSMVIEVLKGSDRSFHPLLAAVRPHPGQKEVSDMFRYLLAGSKLSHQEMQGHRVKKNGVKVQDAYSLRCLAQYQAVNFEKLKSAFETITINANSVSDNPLWVPPEFTTKGEKPWQWVSGGNFIAMHMVEVMDGLRKTLTQITKLSDRHLARMINPHENNGLPPNLSDKSAITQCSFKGMQVQSGMLEVYSSLLSIPVSTFFGVHEENNQDITSHALTSGILGLDNLRLTRYSVSQNLLAVAQAVDLRGGSKYLSPKTQPIYEFVRKKAAYVSNERPLNNDIELMYQSIVNGEVMDVLRKKVFKNFNYSNNGNK